ncbi:UMP-CMP kinase [Neodiprion virginianus]|uniref:UMP-CMP kinase n=1 Tax=Neodiprion fabricii TaxID=2872261 RepID=UPI001ED92D5C|nr:UMP-CMP kinase [Neodiprion fabricii]XP_046624243.1 UMP-CMP kinase [Neodiprion virginianus]
MSSMYLRLFVRRAVNTRLYLDRVEDRCDMERSGPPIPVVLFDRLGSSTSCGVHSGNCAYQISLIIKFSMLCHPGLLISLRKFVMSAVSKPEVIFVLGGPGAGKGTQCTNIVNKYGYVHLSAGELLREEQLKPGSKYGELIQGHMVNGTIVPVQITCSLLAQAMEQSGSNRFLIDGFPRNTNNLDGWNEAMSDKVNFLGVLFFDCSEQVCINRCLLRGASGSGRSDDNEETLKKRFQTYQNSTIPIIKHYEAQGLAYKIDANKAADQVFEDVQKVLARLQH